TITPPGSVVQAANRSAPWLARKVSLSREEQPRGLCDAMVGSVAFPMPIHRFAHYFKAERWRLERSSSGAGAADARQRVASKNCGPGHLQRLVRRRSRGDVEARKPPVTFLNSSLHLKLGPQLRTTRRRQCRGHKQY